MVTSGHVLTKDRLGFIQIVGKDRRVSLDMALGIHNCDTAGITLRKRSYVFHKSGLVHGSPFLVEVHGVIGKIFHPWRLVSRSYGIEHLLAVVDQFGLRDRSRISGHARRQEYRHYRQFDN